MKSTKELIIESRKYGKFTVLIDAEDWEKISQHKWHMRRNKNQNGWCDQYYVRTMIPMPEGKWYTYKNKDGSDYKHKQQGSVQLHRFLMDPPSDMVVDHINGDTLDNRRSNLRICTRIENFRNRKRSKNNTSGYKGVHYAQKTKDMINELTKPWIARLSLVGKRLYLGNYSTPEEAGRAYDEAAKKHYGEFAKLNFPENQNVS